MGLDQLPADVLHGYILIPKWQPAQETSKGQPISGLTQRVSNPPNPAWELPAPASGLSAAGRFGLPINSFLKKSVKNSKTFMLTSFGAEAPECADVPRAQSAFAAERYTPPWAV